MSKLFLGLIKEEELPKFFDRLKMALIKGKKFDDKKNFELEIRSSEEELKGISLEIFTFDKLKYNMFYEPSNEYLENNLLIFSLNLELKEEKDFEIIKEYFDSFFKPNFDKNNSNKKEPVFYDLKLRKNGKKFSFDFISKKNFIIKNLIDLGIDLTKYQNFNLTLKSKFEFNELFSEEFNEKNTLINILTIIFSIKFTGENIKFLIKSFYEALKKVKLNDEKYHKKYNNIINYLNFIYSFINSKIKLEFNGQIYVDSIEKDIQNQIIIRFRQIIEFLWYLVIEPPLKQYNLMETIKSINLDNLCITFGFPKYKNGLAIIIKLPGITQYLNNILS